LGWGPGPDKVGQKRENIPQYDVTPRKSQIKNEIFQSQLEDLLNPWRVWTAL